MDKLNNYEISELIGKPVEIIHDTAGVEAGTTGTIISADESHDNISLRINGRVEELVVKSRQIEILPSSIEDYKKMIVKNNSANENLQEKIDFMEKEGLGIFDESRYKICKAVKEIQEADGDEEKIKGIMATYTL